MGDNSTHDPSDMEQAEGSRETVNANLDEDAAARSRFKEPGPARSAGHDPDLRPDDEATVERPDDMDVTPPHGDKLRPRE